MYIFTDVKTGDVVIDSKRFKGFIERERSCYSCNTNIVFIQKENAYFCPNCNEWIDSRNKNKGKPLAACKTQK